jgi:perosamine synthetase
MTRPTLEPGAPPAAGTIPLSVPHFAGNEQRYVNECFATNWVSSGGPFVDRFEREVAARCGAAHGVAVASGTAALHVALLLAGVGEGDEVVLPAITFIASANAIRYTGAWPAIVDVEPDHWQMDPEKLEEFLARDCARDAAGVLRNGATGRRIAAVMPVHILGHPVDIDRIAAIAEAHRVPLVEDAAESLGALCRGRPVGARGLAGGTSFNGNKIITTGGGGMILTNDAALAKRARHLTTQAKTDPVEYRHDVVGFNYRMSNVEAAIGCGQLEQLDTFIARRRRHARLYRELLADVPGFALQAEAQWATPSSWLITARADAAAFGMDRRALHRALAAQGIQTRPLWEPMHRSEALRGAPHGRIEHADRIWDEALSLPSSANLGDDDIARVAEAIRGARR